MPEMYHPFLVGEKVYLRRVERKDLETEYFQWLNDPEVTRYMQQGIFPNSIENMVAYYEASVNSETQINFAIVTIAENKHIGNIGLNSIDWVNRKAEIGHIIGKKDYWGKGVASEAMELVEAYAFDGLNLRKLCGGTRADNVPVVILFKKLGWVQEGRRREQVMRNDQVYDVLLFGLLREEYYALRAKRSENKDQQDVRSREE